MHFCGDDHLDADRVILKAKTEKRKKKGRGTGTATRTDGAAETKVERGNGRKVAPAVGVSKARKKQLLRRQEALTASIEEAEARMVEIDEVFCEPAYFERTSADEVKILETERTSLQSEVAELTSEWESAEEEIG